MYPLRNKEFNHTVVIRQIERRRFAEIRLISPSGDDVRRKCWPVPGKTIKTAALHEKRAESASFERIDERLAKAISPFAIDKVQRDAVTEKYRVSGFGAKDKMLKVTSAAPHIAQWPQDSRETPEWESMRNRPCGGALRPIHVEIEFHPRQRPNVQIAKPPMLDRKLLLNLFHERQVAPMEECLHRQVASRKSASRRPFKQHLARAKNRDSIWM
jgi:hypothetical protein